MKIVLHPTYFPNIITFAVIAQYDVTWETADNFQKQTFRNRTFICADRGQLMLNIPIQHVGKKQGRQKYADVKIDYQENWQRQHWRTLQTAYRTSPFFEYYEDDIAPIFEKTHDSLLELNLATIAVICDCLQIEMPTTRTTEFVKQHTNDMRFLVNSKKELHFNFEEYNQLFGDRHGFLPNMSMLDLLFNEGANALQYLKNINLDSLNA